ncbi:MAG TPA: lysophospholipid acyltransferase family protein [Gammaproteobacteria bacterium]|jgi:1-acyl-sn-glycerol-3-phosphate acyltransferase|nr:lysophospholipid acyltransferase family protein [Gammaproteobacteria bacterium]
MQNTAKTYSTFNLFIRSSIFFLYSGISIALYSFLCICSFPFPLRYRQWLIRTYLRFYIYLLKIICHVDYRVHGLENIPTTRKGVILCKHQSTWETFFLPTLFHNLAIILKRELLWVPFFGWGLATLDPIAIDRRKKASAMQQIIEKGKKCLADGRWILVFPEGTRMPVGHAGKYQLGGARLAIAANCPIIPIAHNAGRFWPRKSFIKHPGVIQVIVGPVIESEGRTPEELMGLAKAWIETTAAEM